VLPITHKLLKQLDRRAIQRQHEDPSYGA